MLAAALASGCHGDEEAADASGVLVPQGTPGDGDGDGVAAGNDASSGGPVRTGNGSDGAIGRLGDASQDAGRDTPADAGMGGTAGPEAGSAGAGAKDGGAGDSDMGRPNDGGATDAGPVITTGRPCHSSADWSPQSGDLWISPSGSDTNAGLEASPKQTLSAALSAWSAGKTIWIMPGRYPYSAPISIATKGTSTEPLRISGVPGGAKPVFDFSGESRAGNNDGQRGFQISGSYVHLHYLEIAKASDNCVYVTGSNNTLEWLNVHECQDTGVQLSNGAASNKVLNVDSYLNADPGGENADGFAPKLSIGQGNYFCGTRAYQNADDGYDCWSSGDSSSVKFEYCWAFGQPGPTATANGDGNGFKLGSPAGLAGGGNAAHELIDCFAFHNRSVGFTANGNSSGKITCTNCGVWGNGAAAWSAGTGGMTPKHTGDITNLKVSIDQAMSAPRDAEGNLPNITAL